MQIKYQHVYNRMQAVVQALKDLQEAAEQARTPALYAVSQLLQVDLHDAAEDDGVIG